jgi:peroxiredoxin
MTTLPESPQSPRQRPSPVLLVFLILPVLMVGAAAVMMLNSQTPSATVPATPPAVTLPLLPTPVNLADTPLIDFELTALEGQTVRLSDYDGRMVFLNFWQTTCEPCKRELPAFASFVAGQPADGVAVLAVNVAEKADDVRAFLQAQGISGLTVPLDPDADVAGSYGVFQIPVTFAINGDGLIRYIKYGEITREDIDGYIQGMRSEYP